MNILEHPISHHRVADISVIPYPIDLEHKVNHPQSSRDSEGLPLVDQPGGDRYLNPVTISQFALGHHQRWRRTGDIKSRVRLVQCADWLVDNQAVYTVADKLLGVWFYPHDNVYFRAGAPWISAMAQGQALSVLARAWAVDPKDVYLETARRSLATFSTDVNDKGVRSYYSPGEPCYEEVAVEPAAHILNGHLFALFGLWDHVRTWGDEPAFEALKSAITALTNQLDRYDAKYWSRYSMLTRNQLAHPFYHDLHIKQLQYGGTEWGQPSWSAMAAKWERCQRSKLRKGVFALVFNAHRGRRGLGTLARGAWERVRGLRVISPKLNG